MTLTRSVLPVIALLSALLTGCDAPQSPEDSSSLSIMSYNLRFDNPDDGDNRWEARKHRVANLIRFYRPTFVGTQEGLVHQLEYLNEALSGYRRIGISRDGSASSGEFSAIFYDTDKVELVEHSDNTLWLSETPSKPGKSWDADLPRVLTYGQFKRRSDDTKFFVFNTHFDHRGATARVKSAELVVKTVGDLAEGKPVVVTGDFNAEPDSRPYAIMVDRETSLKDAYETSIQPHLGPQFTFEGFEVRAGQTPKRIDYIFVNEQVKVHKHAIISSFRGNRYPSDHLPVYAEISFVRD